MSQELCDFSDPQYGRCVLKQHAVGDHVCHAAKTTTRISREVKFPPTKQDADGKPLSCRDGNVTKPETVDHPSHYGGEDNIFEHVRVAIALGWVGNAFIYNCTKYLWRSGGNYVGRKNGAEPLEDLRKARWYLDRAIEREENKTR